MKKTYIAPKLVSSIVISMDMVCNTGVTGGGVGDDIGDGGVDDGTNDPDAKYRGDMTDEEIMILMEQETEYSTKLW